MLKESKNNYSVTLENKKEDYQYVFPVSVWQDKKIKYEDSKGHHMPGHKRKSGKIHYGYDVPVKVGTPILAIADGTVIQSIGSGKGEKRAGYYISLYHPDSDITQSRYMHMSKVFVASNENVKKGDVIGLSGGSKGAPGSGNSSGPHLHFDININHGGLSKKKSDYITLFNNSAYGIVKYGKKTRTKPQRSTLELKATVNNKPVNIVLKYKQLKSEESKENLKIKDIDMSKFPEIKIKKGSIKIITDPSYKYAISIKVNDEKMADKEYKTIEFLVKPVKDGKMRFHYDFGTDAWIEKGDYPVGKKSSYNPPVEKKKEKQKDFPDLSKLARSKYIDTLYNISIVKYEYYPNNLNSQAFLYRSFFNFEDLPSQTSNILNNKEADERAKEYIAKSAVITQKKKDLISNLKYNNKQTLTIIKRLAGQEKIALENRLSIEDFNPNAELDYYTFTFKNSDISHDILKSDVKKIFIEGKNKMNKSISKKLLQKVIRLNLKRIISESPAVNPAEKQKAEAEIKKEDLFNKQLRSEFNSGKHELTPEIKTEINNLLDEYIAFLKNKDKYSNLEYTIEIVSGTSKVPVIGGNLALSEKRSKAVEKHIDQKITEKSLNKDKDLGTKIKVNFKEYNEQGPVWAGSSSSKKSTDPSYKKHQFISLNISVTGKLAKPREINKEKNYEYVSKKHPIKKDKKIAKAECKRYGKNKTVFSISSNLLSLIYVKGKDARDELIRSTESNLVFPSFDEASEGIISTMEKQGYYDKQYPKGEAKKLFKKNRSKIINYLKKGGSDSTGEYFYLRSAPAAMLNIQPNKEYTFRLILYWKGGLNLEDPTRSEFGTRMKDITVKFNDSFFGKCFNICEKHYFTTGKTDSYIGYKGRRLDYNKKSSGDFSTKIDYTEAKNVPTFNKFKKENQTHMSVTATDIKRFKLEKTDDDNKNKKEKIKEISGSFRASGEDIIFKDKKTNKEIFLKVLGSGTNSFLEISRNTKNKLKYKLEGINRTGISVKIESMEMKIKDASTIILSGEYLDPMKLLTPGDKSSKMKSITKELSQNEMYELLNGQLKNPDAFFSKRDKESNRVKFTKVEATKENFKIDSNLLRKIIRNNIT